MLPAYTATLFLSAFLLFAVQPMFTKMVLPRLGGSPAVWNTAMVFFQATLLGGYAYAHLSTRYLKLPAQQLLHAILLLAGLLFLPIGVSADAVPPVEGSPVLWLIGVLAGSVGLPFLAVAATAPLLQRWFAHIDHPHARDPYFLYGASNLGSLLALLAYPLLIETSFGLTRQTFLWMVGYVVLAGAIGTCGWLLRRNYRYAGSVEQGESLLSDVTWTVRLRWLVLSLVPSSLLLGATLHVGTDIAAAPFLWVLPLALYLLSFVFVFARRPLLPHRAMIWAQALWLAFVVVLFETPHLYVLLVLHLGGVFFTAMVCHGELARLRPSASRLTEFYLWMSLGGVAGGILAAIVAPVVFDSVYEYPLAMLAAVLLRPWPRRSAAPKNKLRWALDVVLPVALFALLIDDHWKDWSAAGVYWLFDHDVLGIATRTQEAMLPWDAVLASAAFVLSVFAILVLFAPRPLRLALGIVAVLAVESPDVLGTLRYSFEGGSGSFALPKIAWAGPDYRLERARSFFGVYSVNYARSSAGDYHILVNGTTNHGAQNQTYPLLPTTYYAREGPVGQAFSIMRMGTEPSRLAAIGLGVGSLSCYVGSDQSMKFFEIDPLEAAIARDERYFTYLSDCGHGPIDIVIGDGRLNIAKEPDAGFDVIIVDAFSGDAIPVHLLTKEAIELYFRKLAPNGLLLLHITNTYIDLLPVVANVVDALGLHARQVDFNDVFMTPFGLPSQWVVVARPSENDLERFGWQIVPWTPVLPDPSKGLWTDDFSSLVRNLRWDQYRVMPLTY